MNKWSHFYKPNTGWTQLFIWSQNGLISFDDCDIFVILFIVIIETV